MPAKVETLMSTLATRIRNCLLTGVLLPALAVPVGAQSAGNTPREFEEIVVSFEIPKLLREDIFVQFDGETVYLPLISVFSLLDINIDADMGKQNFSGFFIDEDEGKLVYGALFHGHARDINPGFPYAFQGKHPQIVLPHFTNIFRP